MRDARKGTYNGELTYCPVNAYGDCPYCDQCGVCHIDDPMEDCDDWGSVWESWDEWLNADDVDPDAPDSFAEDEIRWARIVYDTRLKQRIMRNESTRQEREGVPS